MKLSAKIFYGILGLTISSMVGFAIAIEVQATDKIEKKYPEEFIPLRMCKVIEIGNNWHITIQDSLHVPVRPIIKNRDTVSLCKQFGIHIRHFDPLFELYAKSHIEIRNDTLRFKDIPKNQLDGCYLYIEPFFELISINGNSKIHLIGSFQLARLNINASGQSRVYISRDANINNFSVHGYDQSNIDFYCHDSSSSTNKIELYDYSKAYTNLNVLSKYRVEDHASLIFGGMAISKNKIVNFNK